VSSSSRSSVEVDAASQLAGGKAVRFPLTDGRVHVDRPLPFICVHRAPTTARLAARKICEASASYIVGSDPIEVHGALASIGRVLTDEVGELLVIEVDEFEEDEARREDSQVLPAFDVALTGVGDAAVRSAMQEVENAMMAVNARYRLPRFVPANPLTEPECLRSAGIGNHIRLLFAPIYRIPQSEDIYPELLQRVVSIINDSILRGACAYVRAKQRWSLADHRALGRRAVIDAVHRVDRQMDEACTSFDFLMCVTPINAQNAWRAFREASCEIEPTFLYRPLPVDPGQLKRNLYSIDLSYLEDTTLIALYDNKRQELDLQLSMLARRHETRFRELGRALYGAVEAPLRHQAEIILRAAAVSSRPTAPASAGYADCGEVEAAARRMIGAYRSSSAAQFNSRVSIREDLPSGLMVSGDELLISSDTAVARSRLQALLSHEIGVHLLTYHNGAAQGLRLFRSGLAGHEELQEGLAVFAEFLAGGLTLQRLRLLAARVVAVDCMLDGAGFIETYRLLLDEFALADRAAFNVALRVHRAGGLAKDAIYLRGLAQLLRHLASGGALDVFWIGKFSTDDIGTVAQLMSRGLVKEPEVRPLFLDEPGAARRLVRASGGLEPHELIAA
jgi:uncharacterized protein (TIGR02421 family)